MIGKVIKYKFDNTAALSSVFGSRVYPLLADIEAVKPFCVYSVTNILPQGSKDSDSHIDEIAVDLDLVGDRYSTLQDAVENVRSAFARMKETILGVEVQSCTFNGASEVYNVDAETYTVSIDLVFRIIR